MQGILDLDDGSGKPIDPITLNYDSSLKDAVTPYQIIKDTGSLLEDLMLELANSCNTEIFYNEYGQLTALPIAETMQDAKKQIVWNYNEGELNNEEISHSTTYNIDEFVNEVQIIGTNVNGDDVYGVATNNNTESAFSVPRIGLRIKVLEDSMIANEQEAQDRAIYELRKTIINQTSSNKQVMFNPLLSVNNLIASRNEQGNAKYVIQNISYNMPEGIMNIGISNLENVTEITPLFIRGGPFLLQETGEFFILLEDYSLIRLERDGDG